MVFSAPAPSREKCLAEWELDLWVTMCLGKGAHEAEAAPAFRVLGPPCDVSPHAVTQHRQQTLCCVSLLMQTRLLSRVEQLEQLLWESGFIACYKHKSSEHGNLIRWSHQDTEWMFISSDTKFLRWF